MLFPPRINCLFRFSAIGCVNPSWPIYSEWEAQFDTQLTTGGKVVDDSCCLQENNDQDENVCSTSLQTHRESYTSQPIKYETSEHCSTMIHLLWNSSWFTVAHWIKVDVNVTWSTEILSVKETTDLTLEQQKLRVHTLWIMTAPGCRLLMNFQKTAQDGIVTVSVKLLDIFNGMSRCFPAVFVETEPWI